MEYRILKHVDINKLEAELNAVAREGWEAVNFVHGIKFGLSKGEHMILVKRPLA